MVHYTYNAWGVVSSSVNNSLSSDLLTQANLLLTHNPYVYKGYFYDSETGYYYLKSRYYDPRIHRFLSADKIDYLDPKSLSSLNLYVYCGDNPVMMMDENGCTPWWGKLLIGVAVIVGLGILAAITGGAAGVILGAGFYGALTGAVSGAVISGGIGLLTGGIEGMLEGIGNGAMWGAIVGGASGMALSGINIATGGVNIIGSAQKTGTLLHRFSSNIQAGKFAMQIGRYSTISLDRSLNSAGMVGRKMPDVVAIARIGSNKIVEVVSSTQTLASQISKINSMLGYNSNTIGKVVGWAMQNWFFF